MIGKTVVLVLFAVAVWAFCGAIMGLGPMVMSLNATLVVHALLGPAGAALAGYLYARQFGAFSPVTVAASFVAVALALDFGLVATVFLRSYEMFSSIVGVWLPMALIFLAALLGGRAGHTSR